MKKLILFAVLSLFLIKGHATDQFVFFQKETGYFTLNSYQFDGLI